LEQESTRSGGCVVVRWWFFVVIRTFLTGQRLNSKSLSTAALCCTSAICTPAKHVTAEKRIHTGNSKPKHPVTISNSRVIKIRSIAID
jgi:hypothetical protein